jgi:hypothetical protein
VAFSPTPSAALRHCGTGIWRDRDIPAGWRDLETPCASLPTRSPSQRPQPRGKPAFLTFESGCGRETDSPLEGTGFEPSVPLLRKALLGVRWPPAKIFSEDCFWLNHFTQKQPGFACLGVFQHDRPKAASRKIRISRCDDESAKCSGSSQLAPPSGLSAYTPPSTTPSISNAISSRARRSGSSEPRRQTNGELRLPPRDRVFRPWLLPLDRR